MRFQDFIILDKSVGEKSIILPPTKNDRLNKILNATDNLVITNYNPKKHPNNHILSILHKPKESKSKFEVKIYYETGRFPTYCAFWTYVIWKDSKVRDDEGELSDPQIDKINEILDNFGGDFRLNIKGFLNHCQYAKIVEIQMTL
ncbi:hypothetical protein [Labilibaculum euxinus]